MQYDVHYDVALKGNHIWRICIFLGPPLKIKVQCSSTDQLLILVLHLQSGRDAVPRVQEGAALALLRQVVDKDANQVDSEEDEDVCGHGLPLVDQQQLGVE